MSVFTIIAENPTCSNFTEMLYPVRKCFKRSLMVEKGQLSHPVKKHNWKCSLSLQCWMWNCAWITVWITKLYSDPENQSCTSYFPTVHFQILLELVTHEPWGCGESQPQPLQTAGGQTLGTANFSNYSEARACKIKVWPNCQAHLCLGRLHVVLLISDRDPRRRFDNPWAKTGTKPSPGWLLSSCWAKKAHEPQGWPIFVLYRRKTQHSLSQSHLGLSHTVLVGKEINLI